MESKGAEVAAHMNIPGGAVNASSGLSTSNTTTLLEHRARSAPPRPSMRFALSCAYAYGTSALRTHLMSGEEEQTKIAWEAFAKLRDEWRGKIELQGVSLSVLSFFRDENNGVHISHIQDSFEELWYFCISEAIISQR